MLKKICAPNLNTFRGQDDEARNRLLLDWLSDDGLRARLFEQINRGDGSLIVPSRDWGQRESDSVDLGKPRRPPPIGHKPVKLVTRRDAIAAVLRDKDKEYSSRVYAELGGGSFMLALDPKAATAHVSQRDAFFACFPHKPDSRDSLLKLAQMACEQAAVMAMRTPEFDLATFAEQAAVRFCLMLLGYSFRDYTVLELSLRAAYRGLVYQVLGRHFTTDPLAIPAARQAMARLLARTSELIDAYATEDEDALKGCEDYAGVVGLEPVLRKLGKLRAGLNGQQGTDATSQQRAVLTGEQRAILAVGAAVGTVGNVQAAACIAVSALFLKPDQWKEALKLLREEREEKRGTKFQEWQKLLRTPLRENPPIPFLPRMKINKNDEEVEEVLLALGGGTQDGDAPAGDDPLVWGLPDDGRHWCAGKELAWPLIVEIVRHVMCLPGLDQGLDPTDCSVIGLKKRWGFACVSYPLTHQRERRVSQSSLNVAMRLKSPVKDNADRVREVIRAGAPRIEQALREARHVHFAWFELIESDTVLVLHTVYDGPFSAYLQHFALKVGHLFDALFECIENPPPMPVKEFPHEFVAHLLRYDRAPTMGYFFSAYPRLEVAAIQRIVRGRP